MAWPPVYKVEETAMAWPPVYKVEETAMAWLRRQLWHG